MPVTRGCDKSSAVAASPCRFGFSLAGSTDVIRQPDLAKDQAGADSTQLNQHVSMLFRDGVCGSYITLNSDGSISKVFLCESVTTSKKKKEKRLDDGDDDDMMTYSSGKPQT